MELSNAVAARIAKQKTDKPTSAPEAAPSGNPMGVKNFTVARKKPSQRYEWEYVHIENGRWVVGKRKMAWSEFAYLINSSNEKSYAIYVTSKMTNY